VIFSKASPGQQEVSAGVEPSLAQTLTGPSWALLGSGELHFPGARAWGRCRAVLPAWLVAHLR